MSRRWIKQNERGSPILVCLIGWIALHIGRQTARLFLYPITLYFLLTASSQRRASRHYLNRVFDNKPTIWHTAKHIHCFASTILDRVYFLTNQHHNLNVTLHNLDLIQTQIQKKQGCILLGSHLGSFEVLRTLAVSNKIPIKVLMYKEHNENITRILEAIAPDIKDTIISLGDPSALLTVNECLEKGMLIGMLGDRAAESNKVCCCRFLGHDAMFPTGPIILANLTKVPIFLFFGIYHGGNRYDIYFELLAESFEFDRKLTETNLQYWTQRYVNRLEFYAKTTPYNWFNFYDFWEDESLPAQ